MTRTLKALRNVSASAFTQLVLLALFCLAAATTAPAQLPDTEFYEIQYVQVRPDHWMDYQDAVADLVALYAKHDYKYPLIARENRNAMEIRYISPLASMADREVMDAEFERFRKAAGAAYETIAARFQQASISSRTAVYRMRPDLSYQPDNPQPAVGEANFHQIGYWYIQRDKVAESEANAKAYADLLRKKGIRRPFSILESYIGDEALYLLVLPGTSPAAFYAESEAINRKLGAEGEQATARALQAARDWIIHDSANLPRLTYTP
jgi:hypothetical protein